jgi:hypothetical protein
MQVVVACHARAACLVRSRAVHPVIDDGVMIRVNTSAADMLRRDTALNKVMHVCTHARTHARTHAQKQHEPFWPRNHHKLVGPRKEPVQIRAQKILRVCVRVHQRGRGARVSASAVRKKKGRAVSEPRAVFVLSLG